MKKAIIILIAVILVVGGFTIGTRNSLNVRAAEDLYNDANDKYTTDKSSAEGIEVVGFDEEEEELITSTLLTDEELNAARNQDEDPEESITYSYRYIGPWEDQVDVDLKTLTADYPDVKGWLFFENEDISYPIVQSVNDDVYIRTSHTGKSTSAGSIFMEALNSPDFSDSHTIIYGHNMRNRSMFGALRNYVNQPKYYDYHKYFQIITLDSEGHTVKSRYKVFAYGKTKSISKIYTVCREHDSAFTDILQYIQGNSTVTTDVPVYETDSIVTLSTCQIGENRLAVSAVKVDEVIQ